MISIICTHLHVIHVFLQVIIEKLVTAMGGVLLTKASLDINFVIVKDVLAAKYKVCWSPHKVI